MNETVNRGVRGLRVPQPRDVFEQELLSRKPLMLKDGTSLADLVDIKNREIQVRVLNDPELHQLEMDKIWARCWIPICHETDLPNPGDFKRGYIGEDRVILARAKDGTLNLLLNVCSHRAMEVCWSDEGNSQSGFKCPYHGWQFDLKGNLLGAPFEKEEYPGWDKSKYPLKTAKLTQRHGVYFATFNPNPPSLEDYLTEFVGFFDLMFGQQEMISTRADFGDIGRGVIPANWKAVAEQNCGDGYHAVTLHHSLHELGMNRGGDVKGHSLDCYDTSCLGGHGLRVAEVQKNVFGLTQEEGKFPFGWFIAGSMFPSCFVGMSATNVKTKNGLEVPMYTAQLGPRAPNGPGQSTGSGFGMVLVNKDIYEMQQSGELAGPIQNRNIPFNFAIASAIDDAESWMSESRNAKGSVSRQQTIKYNSLDGASDPDEFPKGLGLVHRGVSKDDNQWHFWLAYYDWMTRE